MIEPKAIPIIPITEKYSITGSGFIINKMTGQKLKGFLSKGGYRYFDLHVNGKKERFAHHRIIATKFVENKIGPLAHVHHIDFDRDNNHYLNLEWCTPKHNNLKSRDAGRKRDNYSVAFTPEQIEMLRFLRQRYLIAEIGELVGYSGPHISDLLNKRYKTQ